MLNKNFSYKIVSVRKQLELTLQPYPIIDYKLIAEWLDPFIEKTDFALLFPNQAILYIIWHQFLWTNFLFKASWERGVIDYAHFYYQILWVVPVLIEAQKCPFLSDTASTVNNYFFQFGAELFLTRLTTEAAQGWIWLIWGDGGESELCQYSYIRDFIWNQFLWTYFLMKMLPERILSDYPYFYYSALWIPRAPSILEDLFYVADYYSPIECWAYDLGGDLAWDILSSSFEGVAIVFTERYEFLESFWVRVFADFKLMLSYTCLFLPIISSLLKVFTYLMLFVSFSSLAYLHYYTVLLLPPSERHICYESLRNSFRWTEIYECEELLQFYRSSSFFWVEIFYYWTPASWHWKQEAFFTVDEDDWLLFEIFFEKCQLLLYFLRDWFYVGHLQLATWQGGRAKSSSLEKVMLLLKQGQMSRFDALTILPFNPLQEEFYWVYSFVRDSHMCVSTTINKIHWKLLDERTSTLKKLNYETNSIFFLYWKYLWMAERVDYLAAKASIQIYGEFLVNRVKGLYASLTEDLYINFFQKTETIDLLLENCVWFWHSNTIKLEFLQIPLIGLWLDTWSSSFLHLSHFILRHLEKITIVIDSQFDLNVFTTQVFDNFDVQWNLLLGIPLPQALREKMKASSSLFEELDTKTSDEELINLNYDSLFPRSMNDKAGVLYHHHLREMYEQQLAEEKERVYSSNEDLDYYRDIVPLKELEASIEELAPSDVQMFDMDPDTGEITQTKFTIDEIDSDYVEDPKVDDFIVLQQLKTRRIQRFREYCQLYLPLLDGFEAFWKVFKLKKQFEPINFLFLRPLLDYLPLTEEEYKWMEIVSFNFQWFEHHSVLFQHVHKRILEERILFKTLWQNHILTNAETEVDPRNPTLIKYTFNLRKKLIRRMRELVTEKLKQLKEITDTASFKGLALKVRNGQDPYLRLDHLTFFDIKLDPSETQSADIELKLKQFPFNTIFYEQYLKLRGNTQSFELQAKLLAILHYRYSFYFEKEFSKETQQELLELPISFLEILVLNNITFSLVAQIQLFYQNYILSLTRLLPLELLTTVAARLVFTEERLRSLAVEKYKEFIELWILILFDGKLPVEWCEKLHKLPNAICQAFLLKGCHQNILNEINLYLLSLDNVPEVLPKNSQSQSLGDEINLDPRLNDLTDYTELLGDLEYFAQDTIFLKKYPNFVLSSKEVQIQLKLISILRQRYKVFLLKTLPKEIQQYLLQLPLSFLKFLVINYITYSLVKQIILGHQLFYSNFEPLNSEDFWVHLKISSSFKEGQLGRLTEGKLKEYLELWVCLNTQNKFSQEWALKLQGLSSDRCRELLLSNSPSTILASLS